MIVTHARVLSHLEDKFDKYPFQDILNKVIINEYLLITLKRFN